MRNTILLMFGLDMLLVRLFKYVGLREKAASRRRIDVVGGEAPLTLHVDNR